jgi:hypothetical protein
MTVGAVHRRDSRKIGHSVDDDWELAETFLVDQLRATDFAVERSSLLHHQARLQEREGEGDRDMWHGFANEPGRVCSDEPKSSRTARGGTAKRDACGVSRDGRYGLQCPEALAITTTTVRRLDA